jgi:uncharacterized protein
MDRIRPIRTGLALALLALMLLTAGRALALYDRPAGRVNDFANVIPPEKRARLEERLKDLDERASIELVVVTVPDLEGRTVEDYTVELAKKWKIGKREKNNGVLFFVAPKEKKVRIEVGYGLEGALTDALSRRILRMVVVPRFRNGDFGGGIISGVDAIIGVVAHDLPNSPGATPRAAARPEARGLPPFLLIVIIFFLVIVVILSIIARRFRGFYGGGGGWGPGGGGFFGGGGRGGSDGGFSGGGGDFGGGGSSDSWD